MNIEIGTALNVGIKRRAKQNQDSLGVWLPSFFNRRPPLLIVADGMGGYTGGEVASQAVVRSLKQVYSHSPARQTPQETLQAGIQAGHQAIQLIAARNPAIDSMGSTVVAVVLRPDGLFTANVGDSRAYRINEREMEQISYDQSEVMDALRAGLITEAQVRSYPRRNVLTMAISARRPDVTVVCGRYDWQPGDRVVLCSDGLWGSVTDAQIQMVVNEMAPQAAADKLVELANYNQGPDNISVIVAYRKS